MARLKKGVYRKTGRGESLLRVIGKLRAKASDIARCSDEEGRRAAKAIREIRRTRL
jgi:hypothetical protein